MERLNYHHLYYFWAVAKSGSLTQAADELHVSQSAVSVQIRQLEEQLEQPLFERVGRTLKLTEAGTAALAHAETIFATGNELMALLRGGGLATRQVVRVGSVSTLSRNFQENFLKPLLGDSEVQLVLESGSLDRLLERLRVHNLDIVLSNRPASGDKEHPWRCRRVARQPVSLVGKPRKAKRAFRFGDDLRGRPMLLPGRTSEIRTNFDVICEALDLTVTVLAEVDDMAMLRLLARDTDGIALVPTIVVRDELQSGKLEQYCEVPQLHEDFYAITIPRLFQSPALKRLLKQPAHEVLDPIAPGDGAA